MTSYFSTTIGQREQLDRLLDQAGLSLEDVKRILADPSLADRMVNALNASPFVFSPKSVVDQVEHQLNAWKNLGVVITDEQWQSILEQAEHFVPDTDSDIPLVTSGFGYANLSAVAKKLFEAFTPPEGYTKRNYIEGAELRYVPGMEPTGGLRLVHYYPNTYAGLHSEAAVKAAKKDKVRLAGLEVLEYLVLNPESGLKWDGRNYFCPNLSGLQQKQDGTWSGVPYLYRWSGCFELHSDWDGNALARWASPSVREC